MQAGKLVMQIKGRNQLMLKLKRVFPPMWKGVIKTIEHGISFSDDNPIAVFIEQSTKN